MDRNLIWGMAIGVIAAVIAYELWDRIQKAAPDDDPHGSAMVQGHEPAAKTPTRGSRPLDRRITGAEVSVEELQAEVASLSEEVARLQLESTMARGQLAHYEGEALPWPEDLPAGLAASGFEDAMRQAAEGMGDGELMEVDCGEFPCVAIFESHAENDDWHRAMVDQLPGGDELGVDGEVGTMVWASEAEGAEGRARLLGVSMVPEDELDEDARTRLEFRAGILLEDMAEQALQPRR
jgi:hypothetical protein